MEKDKLISFIASKQSLNDHPDVAGWINMTEENREEYIRYKNLWAIMQPGSDMPAARIRDALVRIRKRPQQKKKSLILGNLLKYAAIIIVALLGGYLIGTVKFKQEISMNEVFVPNGNRSSVTLPDGTRAWLNNGTKLIYPENFRGQSRVVELEGEGFFDVTHDKSHPFIVKIGENRIKVLGTKFAVTAYPDDKFMKAELVSGQIQFDIKERKGIDQFHSYFMKPSQSLVFDKSSGKISESKITGSFYSYWEDGVYQFKDERFDELAKKIERIYNVKVIFEDETLKKRLFSGSFKH